MIDPGSLCWMIPGHILSCVCGSLGMGVAEDADKAVEQCSSATSGQKWEDNDLEFVQENARCCCD